MHHKITIAVLSAVCLSVVCLTGCGSQTKQSEEIAETTAVSETAVTTAASETLKTTVTTITTLNPIYPTDVPAIQKSTSAPTVTMPAVNYNWDALHNNTISGTADTYTPEIVTPVSCTYIADNAFLGNETVENVSFANPYTGIGSYAFSGCPNLKTLNLPSYIETISPYAFQDCISLKTLELPETVTEIGESAFFGCTSLTSVQLNEGLQKIDKTAFYGCSSLVNVILPGSVTEIGDYAFGNCENLLNITIPASVKKCGLYPVSGSADVPAEKQNNIQVFVQKNSWMDLNFDMVFGGTTCMKVYY